MILINCTLKFNDQIYKGLLVEYAKSNDGITIRLADDDTAVQKLWENLYENDLRTKIEISGSDDKGGSHKYELMKPTEYQLDLNPYFVTVRFNK